MFDVQKNADGSVNVLNVPIFKAHRDRRYNCDEAWLDRCVADFIGQKVESVEAAGGDEKYAMLPSITEGHTPENPDAPEPPSRGFLDNVRRVGRYLHGDFMRLSRTTFEKMKRGELPYRSAEVIPSKHRITNVSLLGGRYPHFPLPVARFNQRKGILRYTLSLGPEKPPMFDQQQLTELATMIAPMVADIMTNKQAEAAENDFNSAGASDEEQASESGSVEQGGGEDEQLHAYRLQDFEDSLREEPVQRHRTNGTSQIFKTPQKRPTGNGRQRYNDMTAEGQRADAMKKQEFNPNTDQNEGAMTGESLGSGSNPAATKHRGADDAQRYRALERQNAELQGQIEQLQGNMNTLQRHMQAEAQTAKRLMIRAKVREVAALGYAIGDSKQIDRHVNRMVVMKAEEIKDYIEDVLKGAPKVNAGLQRHGTVHDVIRNPGSSGDENERYFSENEEQLKSRFKIESSEVLALGDVLG